MLRVTTLHASSATATATYYAQYLTAAPGEVPGVWSGRQADRLGLSGRVEVDHDVRPGGMGRWEAGALVKSR